MTKTLRPLCLLCELCVKNYLNRKEREVLRKVRKEILFLYIYFYFWFALLLALILSYYKLSFNRLTNLKL